MHTDVWFDPSPDTEEEDFTAVMAVSEVLDQLRVEGTGAGPTITAAPAPLPLEQPRVWQIVAAAWDRLMRLVRPAVPDLPEEQPQRLTSEDLRAIRVWLAGGPDPRG